MDDVIDMALAAATGFIQGVAIPFHRDDQTRELLTLLARARGKRIKATTHHDAGAFARCSWCGRYTACPASILEGWRLFCDCGKADGWSGSFKRPGRDAQWSILGKRERTESPGAELARLRGGKAQ